ncbi:MAG: HAMP domain-containing protein, partial [Acidobacteriota bacterium]
MRAVRFSLAFRFIGFISLLVLATSVSLSAFFLVHYASSQDRQLRQEGVSLIRSFAYNAELGVLTRNKGLLHELAVGLFQEPDVVSVKVSDGEGVPLLEEDRGGTEDKSRWQVVAGGPMQADRRARISALRREGSRGIVAYEVSYPVFTQRATHQNEEIGFMLEPGELGEHNREQIGVASVTLSLTRTHQELFDLELAFGLLTFMVIGVAILLTVTLVRRMVSPLQELARATRRIADGNLDETVEEGRFDEIGQLAHSFNQMTSRLRQTRRDLEMYSADLENQVRLRTRELEEAQSQLVHAEKMSAIGLLVSGVAHELNNPLAGVVGYAQLLLRSGAGEPVQRGLQKINREAECCKR